jgi:hypothetical protein
MRAGTPHPLERRTKLRLTAMYMLVHFHVVRSA